MFVLAMPAHVLKRIVLALAVTGLTCSAAWAAPQGQDVPPIKDLSQIRPNDAAFAKSSADKPLEIGSADAAAACFGEEEVAALKKAVDFNKQRVLVFAWRGSGGDRLTYSVMESYPEQIAFTYKRGLTRDLRPHTHVFAVRANVTWKGPGGKVSGGGNPDAPVAHDAETGQEQGEYVKVDIRGKLNAEVMAIGAETTGFMVTAGEVGFEVDFGDNEKLRELARSLHEQTVHLTGKLVVRKGVEIPHRWVVEVDSLKAADGNNGDTGQPAGDNPYLSAAGQFTQTLVFRDGQYGFAGESGMQWTIEQDGAWKRQPFLNQDVRDPEAHGHLSAEEIKSLAGILAKHDLLGLPAELGQKPGVNPHVFALMFGNEKRSLTAIPGGTLPESDAQRPDAPEQRFAAIARAIMKSLTERE